MSRFLLAVLYTVFISFIVLLTAAVVATPGIHAKLLKEAFLQF